MLDRRTDAVQLEVQRAAGGSGEGRCVITVADPELVGHEAELALELRVEVLDSRPVHAERELFRTRLRLDGPRVEVPVPESALCCYRYAGSKIRMAVHAVLTIDDGLLFDSKAEAEQALAIPDRPALREDAESPLVGSLALSGAAGALVWLAIRRQLRCYMRFEIWEVQLLHPLFVDQELPGDCEGLLYQEFLEA